MRDKTILLSSYHCNPYGLSESKLSFEWLKILLQKFTIILLTTKESEDNLLSYFNNSLPTNLKILAFPDRYPLRNKSIIHSSLKLGYFIFNYRITKYLKNHKDVLDSCDIIFQKSPENFRYFTSLTKFNKPVYIGPFSGGLKPPKALKDYFKKEPFLFKLRNLDNILLKLPMYKRQFKNVEKVLICFEYVLDILPKSYTKRHKFLLSAGINCSSFSQATPEKNSEISLLYVGRLTKFKGAELLIKAVAEIKNYPFHLDIVGDGEERSFLESLTKSLGLTDKITFHGFKPSNKIKEFYKNATIFCFPSITESIGIVFYEAMASGLPIITINNGGPKYICPPDGAIKIPIDKESKIISNLAESIKALINSPIKRKEMGQFNRLYCEKNYDWEILAEKITSFFDEEIKKF